MKERFHLSSPNSTDRVILCRGEQRAILNCLRDIFTQIEKIPPRGQIHLCESFSSPISQLILSIFQMIRPVMLNIKFKAMVCHSSFQ